MTVRYTLQHKSPRKEKEEAASAACGMELTAIVSVFLFKRHLFEALEVIRWSERPLQRFFSLEFFFFVALYTAFITVRGLDKKNSFHALNVAKKKNSEAKSLLHWPSTSSYRFQCFKRWHRKVNQYYVDRFHPIHGRLQEQTSPFYL
jgi:hypothetical protein